MKGDDVALVNLRVIAKLQPGDRLQCCDSRYFGIDRGWMTFIWRWLKADTRQITLERLEETIRAGHTRRDEPAVVGLLESACQGLTHLRETYHTDPTTVSRLESIQELCTPVGDDERAL